VQDSEGPKVVDIGASLPTVQAQLRKLHMAGMGIEAGTTQAHLPILFPVDNPDARHSRQTPSAEPRVGRESGVAIDKRACGIYITCMKITCKVIGVTYGEVG
jgi:hypothetical protein